MVIIDGAAGEGGGQILRTSLGLALAVGRPWELREPPVLVPVPVGDTGLVVDVPSSIATPPTVNEEGGVRIFSFGSLLDQVAAVEIVVNTLPEAVAPEDMASLMEQEKVAAQRAALPGAVRVDDAKIENVGDYPFVTVSHRINTVMLRSWITVFGDREVVLRVYAAPGRSFSTWAGVDERIAASLRHPMKVGVTP